MENNGLNKPPRADMMTVNTKDHDRWCLHELAFRHETLPPHLRNYHPERDPDGDLGPGYYDEYIPDAYNVSGGKVLKKTVEYKTLSCPDCDVDAYKDDKSQPICPECGLIVTQPGRPDYDMINDPKATDRVDSNGNLK